MIAITSGYGPHRKHSAISERENAARHKIIVLFYLGAFNPNFLAQARGRRSNRRAALDFNAHRKTKDPNGLLHNQYMKQLPGQSRPSVATAATVGSR